MTEDLRNIAIIAHVDHGKTTLVDQLLRQSGTLDARAAVPERVMDSNDLERERGITILAKNTAIRWGGYRINIVDTPGHADFGGEVERVLSMVDSVLLLVDAVDGPMPQTRFVTQKAFAHGLKPIVVINKIDRDGARPHWVLDQTFDLFDKLGASEAQLDFPVVYASALLGYASLSLEQPGKDMTALFETIVRHTPPPPVDLNGPFQMQLSALDYSSYVGAIGIGRIARGHIARNTSVTVVDHAGQVRRERVLQIFGFLGLNRVEVPEARAGDIIAVTGIAAPRISDTLCDPEHVEALPTLSVDEPTISMTFETNSSPFAGQDGKFLTSRQVRERLYREVLHNVALRVEDTDSPEKFRVSGRGELHLSILLETMRREGYEIAVSRPQVIYRQVNGERHEPFEALSVDVEERHQGGVMEALGRRGADLSDMRPDGRGRVRLDYLIPARGLIGLQTEFRTLTSGSGLMHHVFDHYGPTKDMSVQQRANGAMISNATGKAVAYGLFNLQERGRLMVAPGEPVFEGQIVGIHARDNDLTVNPTKTKQLTNIRAAGRDENILLTPALRLTLEQALEFIEDDELVEITPHFIRLRKRWLKEHERRKAARVAEAAA
ncbi:MAG: translational GTPase TypA [Gammaproteobacteria bacterium]|nr:translational GTPase TypA [Gammaproteobacteria bacterium]